MQSKYLFANLRLVFSSISFFCANKFYTVSLNLNNEGISLMEAERNQYDTYQRGGGYSSSRPVSKPADKNSRVRYSSSEGHKTPGMSSEYRQQSSSKGRTNIFRQQMANFMPGKKHQPGSPKEPYSQRNSSEGTYAQKSNRQSHVYAGSNYSTGRTGEKRMLEKPATSTSQTQLRQQSSNPVISGSSVKTESEPQAKVREHESRHLSEIEKKTAKLANGVKEMRVDICGDNYEKYLESAVDFMTSVDCFSDQYCEAPKKAEITDENFAAFFQLQRAFKGREEEAVITQPEFNKKREALGKSDAASTWQVGKLIDLLGDLGTKGDILNQYRTGFTDDMQLSIRRAVYCNAVDRLSRKIGLYEEGTKRGMMNGDSITKKEPLNKTESGSKSSEKFGLKELDDLKISDEFIMVMRHYMEKDLTGLPGYAERIGLLKKKDAHISTWSRSEVKELFDDLHIVAEYHLAKPCYNASKNVYVKPKRNSGDYDIKRALRLYLRGGNHQFTDDDVLAQTSSYSHHVKYKGNQNYDIYIREFQTKYYDPRYGKKEALSFFHKFDASSQRLIRWRVVEQFVEALFAVRDELGFTWKAKKTEGQSGAESSKESSGQGEASKMISIPSRGTKSSMMNTFANLLPKKVAKVTKGAESMMTKVTESPKREKALDDRFLKNSALNKVRRFINDMAEFQTVKKS